MPYSFTATGHPNITAKHKTTLEFTKDDFVTKTGDCIVGINADFSLKEIKKFIQSMKSKKIKIIISVGKLKEEINAEINPNFNSDYEMVIRKTAFVSERTFAIKSDKASAGLQGEVKTALGKLTPVTVSMDF